MKSFQNFANNIVEAEAPERPKISISGPEILPMQPEGETPTKPKRKSGSKVVKQSEVSAKIQSGFDKRKEAVQKGYIDPTTGRIREKGIVTNRIRARSYGYGDPGKDPLKYGVNPKDVAAEKGTLFQRAVSTSRPERRSARSEIRKGIRSIQTRYPGVSGQSSATSFRGFSRSVGYKPSKGDISTLQRMARPETSVRSAASLSGQLGTGAGRRAQAASDAAKDIANFEKTSAYHQRILKAIDKLPPEKIKKQKITAAPVAPKPQNINLGDTSLPKTLKAPKGSSLSVSAPKTTTAGDIGKAVDQVFKNREARKAAERAKGALKFAKAVKGAGTALSVVGSGLEAKGGYETARGEGASQKRAIGAGAARGLGSFVGGGVGATLGSALGLPGAIAGGAAGYNLGANVGTAAYKALTGDPLKKLTTQGLKTNIRKAVPYEIRKQVPAGARKAFGDFITQAGKTYGNWRKTQQQGANK